MNSATISDMKVKIIKRMKHQTVTAANSDASRELKAAGAGETATATVKPWFDEFKRKSEVNAAYVKCY